MGNKLRSPTSIGHLLLSDSSIDDYLYVQGIPITGESSIDLSGYVQKTTTIAGIDLQDNITKQELSEALGVSPDLNIGNGTINGTLTQKNLSYDQMMLDFEPNMVAYVSYIGAGVSSPTSEQLIALLNSDKTNPYVTAILGDYTFEQYCQGFLAGTGSIQPGVSNKAAIDALIVEQLSDRWNVSSSDDLSNTFGRASDGAVAIGFKNKVYSPAAVTFGFSNQAGDEGYPSESIGAIATGYNTKALGNQSFSGGNETTVDGIASFVFGKKAEMRVADYSGDDLDNATMYYNNRKALRPWVTSHLADFLPSAAADFDSSYQVGGNVYGTANTSVGSNMIDGTANFATGWGNFLSGIGNFSFGNQNTLSSNNSIIGGLINHIAPTFDGGQSFNNGAFGKYNTIRNCGLSVAVGIGNIIGGTSYNTNCLYAFGTGLRLVGDNGNNRFAIGTYNDHNDYRDIAFMVGNGLDENHRSNAFVVTKEGYIVLPNFGSVDSATPSGYRTFKCVNGVLTAID